MYKCTYVQMYVCTNVRMYKCMYVCTNVCINVCMYVRTMAFTVETSYIHDSSAMEHSLEILLPTNAILYTAKLATTHVCPACHQPNDTIDHAFNDCPLWKKVLQKSCFAKLSILTSTYKSPTFGSNAGNRKSQTIFHYSDNNILSKRKTLPLAIMASFQWHLRCQIKTSWFVKRSGAPFETF